VFANENSALTQGVNVNTRKEANSEIREKTKITITTRDTVNDA